MSKYHELSVARGDGKRRDPGNQFVVFSLTTLVKKKYKQGVNREKPNPDMELTPYNLYYRSVTTGRG